MLLRVTQFGEPILRKKGDTIEVFDDALVTLAEDMLETMYEEEGIGIAAQQVGHAKQLFVMDLQLGDRAADFEYKLDGKTLPLDLIMPLAVVNPQIEAFEQELPYEEGCLSFPDIRGEVRRPSWVRMKYQDLAGDSHTVECNGIFARCILHEYDHLQGMLYVDRMEPHVLKSIEGKLKKLKRQTRDFLKAQKKK